MRIETSSATRRGGRAEAARADGGARPVFPGIGAAASGLEGPPRTAAAATTMLTGDGLLALQGDAARGGAALEIGRRMMSALRDLHHSLLETGTTEHDLAGLRRAVAEPPAPSGDDRLDTALALIRQRVAVEIAKRETSM